MGRFVRNLCQKRGWDALGAMLSGLCIVHCLAMPLAVAYLPLLKLEFLEGDGVHQWLAMAAAGIGALSFLPGYLRHRRWSVLLLAGAGLLLLGYGAFLAPGECCLECCRSEEVAPTFSLNGLGGLRTPLGGVVLMLAHGLNCHFARCCSRGACHSLAPLRNDDKQGSLG